MTENTSSQNKTKIEKIMTNINVQSPNLVGNDDNGDLNETLPGGEGKR